MEEVQAGQEEVQAGPQEVDGPIPAGLSAAAGASAAAFVGKTRPGDLVGAGPNWVTFWSKFVLF